MSANTYGEIVPAVPNYRDPAVPVDEAFNWNPIPLTDSEGIVRVVFSSQVSSAALATEPDKVQRLWDLDEAARLDAEGQPGFLHYYPDEIDEQTLLARSFCLWRSAEDAAEASRRPAHREAVSFAMHEGKDVYARYGIEKDVIQRTLTGLIVTRLACMTVRFGEVVEAWEAP